MDENALGGAPAPAETNVAALSEETATHNNPISVQMPEPEKKPVEALSKSDAIKAAQEKVAAKEKEAAKEKPAAETKPEVKTRGEDGKFTPKDQTKPETKVAETPAKAKGAPETVADNGQSEGRVSRYEPPARFNDQGKADWAAAPESVQAEVHRTIKNLEDGFAKHKEAAERFEQIREFDEAARRSGREGIHQTLREIADYEQTILRNPVEGFEKVARHFGLNLHEIASRIVGQDPDQRVQAAHQENQSLKTEMAEIARVIELPSHVARFAASEGRERFYELLDDIGLLLKTVAKDGDPIKRLETAYLLAERFRPAGAQASPAATAETQASPAAETATSAPAPAKPAGQKSISGAPSTGATSGGKKRVLSASEALKAALAQAS